MLNPPLLLLACLAIPLVGAALTWVVASLGRNAVRMTALLATLLTFVASAGLMGAFPRDGQVPEGGFAAVSGDVVTASLPIRLEVGLDGLSVWLFGLSALLMVTAVLVSWEAIEDRPALFYSMLLLLEVGCLGVFAARDLILFYIFFEFTLIPLFFLIGIWGSEDRQYAAQKFFLFTLAGSLLTFLGLLRMVLWHATQAGTDALTFNIAELAAGLAEHPMPVAMQQWVFLALFAGFAIKVPLFPLHTWLPLAHVQAPAAGSVFLAGVMLKMGTYGFLRFSLPMLPDATVAFMPLLLWLSVLGILYGALVALAQGDMKRLIAYSSVSHLGYCMLGIFVLTPAGVQGGSLQMINHGISTGGLFALVGMMYERFHTRKIRDLGGLTRDYPCLAFFMLLFTFSSIGLPGLNGFAGEFLVLLGAFQRGWLENPAGDWQLRVISVLAVFGVVLGAWYMLWLVQRVFFGPARTPDSHDAHGGHGGHGGKARDLNFREILALAPLSVFVFWIGLQPQFFLQRMDPTLRQLTGAAEAVVREAGAETAAAKPEERIAHAARPTRAARDLRSAP